MHPFILFEGIDHTGKTTIARRLEKELGGAYLRTPPEELSLFRPFFDKLDLESNLAYYLVGNQVVAYRVSQLVEHMPVIVDRYFYSTVAFHSAKIGRDLSHLLDSMTVIPDRIYHLTADVDESMRRMGETGDFNQRFHERDLMEKSKANYHRLFRDNPAALEIDTTNRSIEEVYMLVLDDIRKIGKK